MRNLAHSASRNAGGQVAPSDTEINDLVSCKLRLVVPAKRHADRTILRVRLTECHGSINTQTGRLV